MFPLFLCDFPSSFPPNMIPRVTNVLLSVRYVIPLVNPGVDGYTRT
ncbi:hypothetical protein RintRC_6386 [Richelia intracellularis]|nr:hypothetical protein RintRC_6386 [Richelia intracellularis]